MKFSIEGENGEKGAKRGAEGGGALAGATLISSDVEAREFEDCTDDWTFACDTVLVGRLDNESRLDGDAGRTS